MIPTEDVWKIDANAPEYEERQARRQYWFAKIKPATHWKLAIDCWIKADEYDNCNQAAIHFTGGSLIITEHKRQHIRVQGAGYYANIGV